jgi:hypothetical protein
VEGNPEDCELGCRLFVLMAIDLEVHSAMKRAVVSVDRKVYWKTEKTNAAKAPNNYFFGDFFVKVRC